MIPKQIICFLGGVLIATAVRAQQGVEDSLNKIIREYKDEAEVAKAYNALGYEYTRKDVVKARTYFERAIVIGKKINNLKRLSSSYSSLVYLLHKAGYPDSAEYYIGMVKELAMQADASEKDAIYSNYYTVAAMYYKNTGLYKKAIPHFEKAIALLIKMGDKESSAGQMLNLGNTYTLTGNYKKATEQHLKSLRLFEEINNQRGISYCYQSLCNSFTELRQYEPALVYAKKSLEIKTVLNDRRGLGSAQSGLGDIYFGTGNLEKAIYHYTIGLDLAKEQKNLADEQGAYLKLAKVYSAKKDDKQTIAYLTKSRALAKLLHDSASIAAIDVELIAVQHSQNKIDSVENKIKTGLDLFKEQGDLNRQAAAFKNLVDFYVVNNKFDKALEAKDKYYQVIDSIRNNDLQLQIKKMEELYNIEKKEKEITLLKKDKEIQEQVLKRRNLLMIGAIGLALLALGSIWLLINRSKLRQQMKEIELRNRIAADLHDEVGSSLSSIQMLSHVAAQLSEKGGNQRDMLERVSVNARETMEKMGDIVWMIKPGDNEGMDLLERMERFMYEICGSQNIEYSISGKEILQEIKLTMQQRKNFYLIFKESVNNSVKYSGTDKVEVSIETQNQQVVLCIRDFGKGFEPGKGESLPGGNGLNNMKNRAREMGGNLVLRTGLNQGTLVQLEFPTG